MAPTPNELWQHGSGFFSRLKNYYAKDVDTAPLISEQAALLCEVLFTAFYVAPFYLSSTLRSTPLQSRDAPTVIRARVRAVGLTCVACTVITVYVLAIPGHCTPKEVIRLLGIWPIDPIDILRVLGLVMILYICSLYETIIVDGEWRNWSFASFKEGIFDNWIGYRNLIVAPITEEVVFRALTIPLFLLAKTSPTRIVFVTPAVFGLAHLHHLVDFIRSRTPTGLRSPPSMIWLQGILRSTFQFAYTSLFGFFAAFVFLRTGNLYAAIVAHSFCNRMGLPRVWGKVGQVADYDYVPAEMKGQAKRDDDAHIPGSPIKVGNSLMQDEDGDVTKSEESTSAGSKNLGLAWTMLYYLLLFVGAFGFYKMLFTLTDSRNALARF
ncbi:CAAX prenyl protease [Vermiconidia calcicola]|uniref:CAAX prenyl protease n=1 Tax=Vermiconidia calcicola TaxID=1690605 RepID=A0ACC3MLD3_9PEZI|nr:CAAX prenyl protease [Vermiconidia calcicola]